MGTPAVEIYIVDRLCRPAPASADAVCLVFLQDVDQRQCNDGSGPAHEAAGRVRLRQHFDERQLIAALQVSARPVEHEVQISAA